MSTEQGRQGPWAPVCPVDVLMRVGRRGETRLVERAPIQTGNGEQFFVDGIQGNYTVTIDTSPRCTCLDDCTPCKHMCYILLDVLHVPEGNPVWWQTSLVQSEVETMLPEWTGKREREFEDDSSPRPEKQPRVHEMITALFSNPAFARYSSNLPSTVGLEMPSVRSILISAIHAHPDAVQFVEALRPTLLDGLTDDNIRLALSRVAQTYSDIAATIVQTRSEDNEEAIDFSRDVAEARNAIHSLDDLSSRQQFDHSYDVTSATDQVISRIVETVTSYSSTQTKVNAVNAICVIGHAMLGADGEIGKALFGYGEGTRQVSDALKTLARFMDSGKDEVLDALQSISESFADYGHDDLQDLVSDIEEELKAHAEEEGQDK